MLELYNTLTRSKEAFKPLQAGQVSLYTCGPTVYGPAHIGNLRTYVFEDVLKRWLTHGHKLKVNQVMNITDVEDKIIANSGAATVADMAAYTAPFEQRFHADVAALNVTPADSLPKATEYIPQMIALAEGLVSSGFAYQRDGSVYFDIAAYRKKYTYGQLLHIDFSGFKPTERVKADEYDKASPTDFALWKAEEPGTPGWDSPWGYGRPGWHLECSAMVRHELGETIDIHAGAVDLKFPHHENEIAQSQTANGAPLARYWLHGEHLLVDGARMAKSAGNFYTLGDVIEKGFDPVVLRLLFLGAHYRSKLNFTWESLESAKQSFTRIQDFLLRLDEVPQEFGEEDLDVSFLETFQQNFDEAMDDDLNTPKALAALFEMIREGNNLIDQGKIGDEEADFFQQAIEQTNPILGLGLPPFDSYEAARLPQAVHRLVEHREEMRKKQDWEKADSLRREIEQAGYIVKDTPLGPSVRSMP